MGVVDNFCDQYWNSIANLSVSTTWLLRLLNEAFKYITGVSMAKNSSYGKAISSVSNARICCGFLLRTK